MNAFAALADETRREIVKLVAKNGELTASAIGLNFEMSAPAISQHLKILQNARILRVKKEAQKRIYSLQDSGIEEVENWLSEIKALWNKRLDKLERYLLKLQKGKTHEK